MLIWYGDENGMDVWMIEQDQIWLSNEPLSVISSPYHIEKRHALYILTCMRSAAPLRFFCSSRYLCGVCGVCGVFVG